MLNYWWSDSTIESLESLAITRVGLTYLLGSSDPKLFHEPVRWPGINIQVSCQIALHGQKKFPLLLKPVMCVYCTKINYTILRNWLWSACRERTYTARDLSIKAERTVLMIQFWIMQMALNMCCKVHRLRMIGAWRFHTVSTVAMLYQPC